MMKKKKKKKKKKTQRKKERKEREKKSNRKTTNCNYDISEVKIVVKPPNKTTHEIASEH